jgi:hypothetical protein
MKLIFYVVVAFLHKGLNVPEPTTGLQDDLRSSQHVPVFEVGAHPSRSPRSRYKMFELAERLHRMKEELGRRTIGTVNGTDDENEIHLLTVGPCTHSLGA